MRSRSLFAALLFALTVACQPLAPLKSTSPTELRAQSSGHQNFFEVDGAEDRWVENLFRDFDQGLVKENLNLKTQGQVLLKPEARQGRYLSKVYPAPFAFNAFMPAWTALGGVQIQARVSADSRNWGAWLPLFQERSVILPQQARFIQYQVLFTNTDPTRLPVFDGISFQFGKSPLINTVRPLKPHQALVPKPVVMSREAWRARPPKAEYTVHTPDGIVLHHTWKPSAAQYQKDGTIRGIQNYHMDDNKWSDIGYHFLIGPDGVIYQGRPETVVGAHSTPNTGKIGICLIGDFDPGQDPVTAESYAALLDLMTWLTSEYGISTQEFYGHRDYSTKSCPGDGVYTRLNEIKAEVQRRLSQAQTPPPLRRP
jgi:hypothetical protein